MAEQNMMGFAAGLAREGFTPFVHTFAVFVVRRPYDQVAMSIAYPNLPVRLLGFVPGVTTPGGVSHQAIDDLALMRALPNMTVLECGDATDVESVLDVAQSVQGPVYVRMLRGEVPRLFARLQDPMQLDRARELSEGSDLALLTSGICTAEALGITPQILRKGVTIQHLHVSTLKPFSDPAVLDAISRVKLGVITMENHSIIGGLGSATAELLTQVDFGPHRRLIRLGLDDTFAHGASRSYLMREYGLDAMALLSAVEQLAGGSLGLTEEDLIPSATLGSIGSGSVEDL
jgi:transketolase